MILRATSDVSRTQIASLFHSEQVDLARVESVGLRPRPEDLALHHRIDMARDPIPYGGHMTLRDGLWLGRPTIALPGETAVSRAGLSLLTNVGLPGWVAASADDFVRMAVERAGDISGLAVRRASLRQRLKDSPLNDAPRFARGIEAAYRAMWKMWCEQSVAV